jgi:hypothetical protein
VTGKTWGGRLEELEVSHPGASDELSGSRSALAWPRSRSTPAMSGTSPR